MMGDDVWHQREKTWFALSLGLHRMLFKQRNKRSLLSLLTWRCHLEWRTPMPSSHSSKASIDVGIFSAFSFFSSHSKIGTGQQVVWKTAWIKKKKKSVLCYVGNKRRSEHLRPLKPLNSNGVHRRRAAQENQPELSCGRFSGRMYFNAWAHVLSVGVGRRGDLMFNTGSTNTLQLHGK